MFQEPFTPVQGSTSAKDAVGHSEWLIVLGVQLWDLLCSKPPPEPGDPSLDLDIAQGGFPNATG